MNKQYVTQPSCNDCCTNPAVNDASLGPKWIQGGVIKAHSCGCTIEGRGFCNYPLHIHYCQQHAVSEQLTANVRLLVKYLTSDDDRERMDRDTQVVTEGNVSALNAILEAIKLYLPEEGR